MGIFDRFKKKTTSVPKDVQQAPSVPKQPVYKCSHCGNEIDQKDLRMKKLQGQKYYFHRKCLRYIRKHAMQLYAKGGA